MGSLFGKFMEDSGAARAIAEGILKVIGRKSPLNVMLAIAFIGVALTYGGVSLFVVVFALVPIGRPLFKEMNLPWHLFVIPYAFGIGSITMTMLPGSPQILNIMPTKYMASTPMAAPVIGILAAVVVAAFNVFYFKYQLKKSRERGEVYEAPTGVGVVGTADVDLATLPNVWLSIVPMVVVVVLLNVLKLDAVWALAGGTAVCMVFFWNKYKNILDTLNKGAVNTVIPIVNTCADVGYGMAVAATAGFKVIAAWLLTLPMHPIISLSIATNMMAGITGSASGGLGIILETLAPKYLALGLSPELIHRVATMSAGCFDALPHNGVVITFLAVCGLTHVNAYKHVFFGHIVATVLALLIVIPLGILLY
ncbi:MAG: GntP family permease, partial [Deltaproteobacteria bacterium]|nr:GntP family permease [Deltaproteobacteria bacterium]